MPWVRAPLLPVALALAVGIAAAPCVSPNVAWFLLLIGLTWSASLAVLGRLAASWPFLLLGVAAAGVLRVAPLPVPADDVSRLSLPAPTIVEGRLVAEPVGVAPGRTRLVLDTTRVDAKPKSGRIRLTAYGEGLPPLTQGQQLAAVARLHRVTGFRNPAGFDYAAHLRREGILVTGSTRADRVTALDDVRPPWPVRVRKAAREAIERTLPPASAALLGGLLLGARGGLPPEIDEAFRRAGVYHVLAVSGFNVALVAGTVWALLVLARTGHRSAAAVAIGAVVAFALVAGLEPSVLRAVVMGVLVLGARVLDREASVLNSLALAMLVILAARPGDLHDPGFQLSFAATAGIVLAPLPRNLVLGALGVSVAAQLAVLPITLAHFNQFSPMGLLANLAVVPLAAVATVVGLAAVGLSFVTSVGADLLLNAVWPVLLALRGIVALAGSVPGALVHLPAPPAGAIVAYTLGLGLGLLAWRWRHPAPERARPAAIGAVVLLIGATLGALWPLLAPPSGLLRVTVLDVGQGDAIVIEAPDGRTMLVDAGPGGPMRLDVGERVVAPFLWNRGIRRLATAVTTHADLDHAGGMGAIRRHFSIAVEWTGASVPPGRQWLGDLSALVLGPGPAAAPARRANDAALVLRLDYGLASFLLASDATAAAERDLLAAGVPLHATVLKVGHHGARGASTEEFLRRVNPRFAVISVGPANSYGHPAPETLNRLETAGAHIFRTDRDGAVIFETDGRWLTITRWAQGAVERYCLELESACDRSQAIEAIDGRVIR
jgi:competence protein ComEC